MSKAAEKRDEKAQYDIETARAMLKSKRYVYVLFCCQQAIEKAIKARIVRQTGELPPRIHNLMVLCERAKIEIVADMGVLLADLSAFYFRSRYPEDLSGAAVSIDRKQAVETMKKTEEFLEWLSSLRK